MATNNALDDLFTPIPQDDEIEGLVQEGALQDAEELELSLARPEGGVVPAGEYSFEITEVNIQRQTPSGYPNIRYQAVCLDGEGKDLTVFDNVSLSPRSAFIRNEFLDALGLPREGSIKPKNDLAGLRFRAEVTHEMYNGRLQARFLKYIKAEPSAIRVQAAPTAAAVPLAAVQPKAKPNGAAASAATTAAATARYEAARKALAEAAQAAGLDE